jgi:hypothetical protein
MNLIELNKVLISPVSDIINDYAVGYEKQITDAHTIKREFNAILKFIFDDIKTAYNETGSPNFMYNLHFNYARRVFSPYDSCVYPPLIESYRKKYVHTMEETTFDYDLWEYITNNSPEFKLLARLEKIDQVRIFAEFDIRNEPVKEYMLYKILKKCHGTLTSETIDQQYS